MAPSKPRTPLAPHCSGDLIGGGTRSCPPVAMPLTATSSCPAQGALWPAVTPSPTRSTVIRVSPCRLTLCSERVRPRATGWMGSGVSRPPPVSALPGRSLRGPRPPSEEDQKSTPPREAGNSWREPYSLPFLDFRPPSVVACCLSPGSRPCRGSWSQCRSDNVATRSGVASGILHCGSTQL